MAKILFLLLFLFMSNPVKADVIHTFGTALPEKIRAPFYIFLAILAVIAFISIKKDLKKQQEQTQNEAKEEEKEN